MATTQHSPALVKIGRSRENSFLDRLTSMNTNVRGNG